MQVFKLTNKLQIKNILSLIISVVVFIVMAIFVGAVSVPNEVNVFEFDKTPIAVINEDGETEATTSLLKSLEYVTSSQKEIEYDKEKIQDALFYSVEYDYVLIIPKGFSEGLTSGKVENIIPTQEMCVVEYNGIAIGTMIDKFITTYLTYKNNTTLTDTKIFEKVIEDMSKVAELEVASDVKVNAELLKFNVYAKFALLIFFSAICNIIINGSSIYRSQKLFSRTTCAPINQKTTLWQVMLSCLLFIMGVFIIWLLVSLIIFGSVIFTERGLLMILNVLILLIPLTSICVLISSVVKNQEVLVMVTNALAILMAFSAGAFIPQELLSTTLKVIGMITPGWYFVENIENVTLYTISTITNKLLINIGIMVGYAIVMILIAMAVNKYKKVDKF